MIKMIIEYLLINIKISINKISIHKMDKTKEIFNGFYFIFFCLTYFFKIYFKSKSIDNKKTIGFPCSF